MMQEMDNNNSASGSQDVHASPRAGPTLSTSTSSFEALDPHDSNLSRLATKAFEKTSAYISHELTTSLEDYKLLEDMNRATITKYADMMQISENLATSSTQLKEKFENLVCALRLTVRCEILINFLYRLIRRYHIWSKSMTSNERSTNWKNVPINLMRIAKN